MWVNAGPAKEITAACSDGEKAGNPPAIVQNPQNGGISTIIFSDLKPDAKYEYSVKSADGAEIAKGSFKTKPDYKDRTPPPDFSFAVFGENYLNDKRFDPPYKTPGGEYEIYAAADAKKPRVLHMGGRHEHPPQRRRRFTLREVFEGGSGKGNPRNFRIALQARKLRRGGARLLLR